jgi:hypothetical protein
MRAGCSKRLHRRCGQYGVAVQLDLQAYKTNLPPLRSGWLIVISIAARMPHAIASEHRKCVYQDDRYRHHSSAMSSVLFGVSLSALCTQTGTD